MCRHSTIQHACNHITRSQERCSEMPSIFGMVFCDDFQVIRKESDTFCSADGLYCNKAPEGRGIDAIRLTVADIKSELLGIRDILDTAKQYAASRADEPGQLSLHESQLHMTPLSLRRFSNRRDHLMERYRAFASRAQSLRSSLAGKGLARGATPNQTQDGLQGPPSITRGLSQTIQTPQIPSRKQPKKSTRSPFDPKFGAHRPSPLRKSISQARTSVKQARSFNESINSSTRDVTAIHPISDFATSAAAAAVRRSDRLSRRRRVSYNEDDDEPLQLGADTNTSSVSYSRRGENSASDVDELAAPSEPEESPKPKSRRQSTLNRSRGTSRRRRASRAAQNAEKNINSQIVDQISSQAPTSALQKQNLAMLESQRLMTSIPRTPRLISGAGTPHNLPTPAYQHTLATQPYTRATNLSDQQLPPNPSTSHHNPAADVLRRGSRALGYNAADCQPPMTAFRPSAYFGSHNSPVHITPSGHYSQYLTQYTSPHNLQGAVPRQLDMGGMANNATHRSFPQMSPLPVTAHLPTHGYLPSNADPFVDQPRKYPTTPRKVLQSHHSF